MNPGTHQSSKQRGQHLGWKVHEGVHLLFFNTMHGVRNRNVSIG